MSATATNPTVEKIRAARHAGFATSIALLPEARRTALTDSYKKQDARREKNVTEFYSSITGAKK